MFLLSINFMFLFSINFMFYGGNLWNLVGAPLWTWREIGHPSNPRQHIANIFLNIEFHILPTLWYIRLQNVILCWILNQASRLELKILHWKVWSSLFKFGIKSEGKEATASYLTYKTCQAWEGKEKMANMNSIGSNSARFLFFLGGGGLKCCCQHVVIFILNNYLRGHWDKKTFVK